MKIPSKRPLYRGERSHTEFLTKLKDHITNRVDFEATIVASLREVFDVETVDFDKFIGK